MRFLLLAIIYIFSLQLNAQEELIGCWLRVDDRKQNPTDDVMPTQDSTILEVKEIDSVLVGILIKVPKTSKHYGYEVGQIKWKNFSKKEKNNFELEGLLMEQGASGKFDEPSYLKVNVKLIENRNTILLWTEKQGGRFNWSKQKWIRLLNV